MRIDEVNGTIGMPGTLTSRVRVRPGDWIVGEADGVVVVPQEVEEEVIRRAWQKVHAENEVRDAIRGGMSATDAFKKYGVL